MNGKFDSFSGILRGALGDRLKAGSGVLDLFTEDVVFEFPYAPEGLPQRLDGIPALAGHLARIGPMLELGEFVLQAVHPADETVVFEFSCHGRGVATGLPYHQDYISVVTLHEGRIARYRDYWNPLIALHALGGADAAAKAFEGETTNG